MEDKTVIIMNEIPPQKGQPFKWAVMIDGKSTKLISWDKQELEIGNTYKVTLLDEEAKDVQYDQRRMKKNGKVELIVPEKQGTLEDDEPLPPLVPSEPLVEKPKPDTPAPTPDLPTETPTVLPTDDFDEELSGMIEEMENEKANDKLDVVDGSMVDFNNSDRSAPTKSEGSQLAISNLQRSVLPINPNKLELNIESIMILNPIATEQNAMKFLQKCIWQNLNPFIGDCYLITYKNKQTGEQDMSMVVSKDVFLKRSANNPDYEGFEAGIVVRVGNKPELDYREGSIYIKGEEELIGGWARVHIKGLRPIYAQVLVAEYHTNKNLWNTKPATMIRKVALSQAMREAHPIHLQGMYDASEIEANE